MATEDAEDWIQVPDSERFQVSNWGRVRDLQGVEAGEDGIMEPWIENGMPYIWVSELEFGYRGPLWKLVLATWFKGILLDIYIDYHDSDPFNVRPENIKVLIDDPKLGIRREVRTRKDGKLTVLDRRMGPKIRIIETGQVYETTKECADAIGGLPSRIAQVLNGTLKSHKGYTYERVSG